MSRDRLPPGCLRLLAVVALAAGAIVLAILVRRYGAEAMKRLAVLAIVAVSLAGCTTTGLATAAMVFKLGEGVYCQVITEAGRQAARDVLTGGVQVLQCPDGTKPAP